MVLNPVPSALPVFEPVLPDEPELEEPDDEPELDDEPEDDPEDELDPLESEVLPDELELSVVPELLEPFVLFELLESEPLELEEPEPEVVPVPLLVESEVLPLVSVDVSLSESVVSESLLLPYCGVVGAPCCGCTEESESVSELLELVEDVVGETRSETTLSVPWPCVISITMPAVTATVSKPDTRVTITAIRLGSRRRLRSSLMEYV